jgi:membrane protease YdiL (CAAX protease family)
MELTILDTILLALLGLAAPVYSVRSFETLRKNLSDGAEQARVGSYLWTIGIEWGVLALVLAIWVVEGRELAALGLRATPTPGFLGATLLTFAAIGHSIYEVSAARRNASRRDDFRALMRDLVDFMPQTPKELRTFYATSATAAVCEEVVYRGYLMAIFAALGGPIVAVIGSTLIFTLGHAYQPATILRVAAFGLAAGLLYLLSGSLLPVIVLHFTVDVTSGALSYMTFSGDDSADGVTEQSLG